MRGATFVFDHDRIFFYPPCYLPLFSYPLWISWANNSLEISKRRVKKKCWKKHNMTCAILIQIVYNYGPTFTPRRCNTHNFNTLEFHLLYIGFETRANEFKIAL